MTALLISQIFIVITLEQNKTLFTLNLEFRRQQVKNLWRTEELIYGEKLNLKQKNCLGYHSKKR